MTLYSLAEEFVRNHAMGTLAVVFIAVSKLVSVSKLPLDPWGAVRKFLSRLFCEQTEGLNRKIDTLSEKVDMLTENVVSDRKKTLRRSIIRFADECRLGQNHSKEMFNTVLEEIGEYEKLCSLTGDPNHVVAEAVKVIKEINQMCLKENKYL